MIRPAPLAAPECLGLPATEIATAVNGGDLDAASLMRAAMEEIEGRYDLLAVLGRNYKPAIQRARRGVQGPLAGVPVLVSDTLDTAGLTTTFGTSIYRSRVPARSAAAVEALERAGAIVIGKGNVDEFGWGVTGENAHWGAAANPLAPELVSGGACGGPAAGLAAGVCALAIGNDADGGLRIPAGCCGVVAFKPAPHRVDGRGSLPLAPSFDAIGPMARTVRDCAIAHAALVGEPIAQPHIQGLRISPLGAPESLRRLESLGAHVDETELPRPDGPVRSAFLLECGLSCRTDYRDRRAELGPETRRRWDCARAVSAIDALEARETVARWQQRVTTDPPVDLIVTPTLGSPIPARDGQEPRLDPARGLDGGMTRFTAIFGLLGWPALTIGNLQISGRDERVVLGAGLAYEEAFADHSVN